MERIILNDEEYFIYDKKPDYWNCFFFCTQIPMHRIWDGRVNTITVNGRMTAFACFIPHIPSILCPEKIKKPMAEWRMNFPIYAIHYTTLKVEWEDIFHPPIPVECFNFYKKYKNKVHYDEREGIREN